MYLFEHQLDLVWRAPLRSESGCQSRVWSLVDNFYLISLFCRISFRNPLRCGQQLPTMSWWTVIDTHAELEYESATRDPIDRFAGYEPNVNVDCLIRYRDLRRYLAHTRRDLINLVFRIKQKKTKFWCEITKRYRHLEFDNGESYFSSDKVIRELLTTARQVVSKRLPT